MFVWLWLVVNDHKFSAGTVFFSHTNQLAVLLHEPATKRTSQPNRLMVFYNKYGMTIEQFVTNSIYDVTYPI